MVKHLIFLKYFVIGYGIYYAFQVFFPQWISAFIGAYLSFWALFLYEGTDANYDDRFNLFKSFTDR